MDNIAGIFVVETLGQKVSDHDLDKLINHLEMLIKNIKCKNCISEATEEMNLLGKFQEELARACFKWDIMLPPILRQLIREYDRSDDVEIRLLVFSQIKHGLFLKHLKK